MITVINNLVNARFKLYGEAIDENIVEKQVNGVFRNSLPFQFKFNGSWLIEHECSKCKSLCSFGLHFDRAISPYPNLSYQQTQYLCSKYYDSAFLHTISNLFVKTEIISNEKGDFVILENFYDEDFPISSSIQPVFYSCKNSSCQFLCILRVGFPYPPDNGCHEGLIGTVFIDEIVQIEGNSEFVSLLEKHRV